MPGAIIPDDWDGSTFICQKVKWPASPSWQAILLGQVTEPSFPGYWDPETGSVEDATEAVDDAFDLTIPDIYTEDCEDVPTEPEVAFKVEINTPFAMTPYAWNLIPWADYFYTHNNPGFDFGWSGHQASDAGHIGLWHYNVQLNISPGLGSWAVRASVLETGQVLGYNVQTQPYCGFGFDYVWTDSGYTIVVHAYPNGVTSLQTNNGRTNFSGHYLGPVES